MPLEPRKKIGVYTVFERVPKPRGMTKYVVGCADPTTNGQDFGKFSTAVRYCKQRTPRKPVHIVVFDDKSAVATAPVDYTIIDPPHVHHASAAVDPAMVAGVLAKAKEAE